MPMQVYAAGFDRTSDAKGWPAACRRRAEPGGRRGGMRALPGGDNARDFPYAAHTEKLLTVARLTEHEYLLSLRWSRKDFR